MARAAANEYKTYLSEGPGKPRQAATMLRARTNKHHVVILPEFIKTYGDFNAWNVPENGNYTKTIVYLSCCHSARGSLAGRPLLDAFRSAGADLVCGWDWAVTDGFSLDKDTTLFCLMCDTFLPFEAFRALGVQTDPNPIDGKSARLYLRGDSLVMIEPVLFATLEGVARRAEQVSAETSAAGASVTGRMMSATREDLGKLAVSFPGPAAGSYDFGTVEGAKAEWIDQASGRTYVAQKDYQGIAGNISVSDFAYNVIMAVFSGTLGWWDTGRDPKQDQPDAVVQLDAGRIKFTGKMGADSVAPQETTYHHGYIDADETWSPSGNPHIIDGDVALHWGVWLTIEPGCVVKFDNFGLNIGALDSGGLTAVGTASAPILFTSNQAAPAPGDWTGIFVGADVLPGTRLSYCTIEYAGFHGFEGAAITMGGGGKVDEISNCTIQQSGMYGVFCREYAGFNAFRDNVVTANQGYALRVDAGLAELLDQGNTLTGNDSAGVELYGRLSTSATWPDLGVPYVIKDVSVGDSTNNPVLTIESGAEVRFKDIGGLRVGKVGANLPARIVADGISFTSAAQAPSPGDFYGVNVYGSLIGESEFRGCDFSYGGQGGGGLLSVVKCDPVITGCDFGYSEGWGIIFQTAQVPDTVALRQVNTFHNNVLGDIKWMPAFPGPGD
jgi:hypothetical protein